MNRDGSLIVSHDDIEPIGLQVRQVDDERFIAFNGIQVISDVDDNCLCLYSGGECQCPRLRSIVVEIEG